MLRQSAQPDRMNPALAPSVSPSRRPLGVRYAGSWLPLVLLWSCVHFLRTDAAADLRPEIIAPLKPVRMPALGERFSLSCQARSPFPGMYLIYWLANRSFVEDQYPTKNVSEGPVREEPDSRWTLLSRELLFHSFSAQDRSTSFTCMVRNPAGLSKAPVLWQPEPPAQGWEPQQETMQDGQPPNTHTPWTVTEAQTTE